MIYRQEQFDKMAALAARVAAKSKIESTRFSPYVADYWLRNQTVALTEGWLRGRKFAAWMPISSELYEDEDMRELITERARHMWRMLAERELFQPTLLLGPRKKLPA